MSRRVAILTGVPPHTDPWHDLGETSRAVAAVLSGSAGLDVSSLTTDDDVAGGIGGADVVLVNVSADLAAPDSDSTAIVDALVTHVGSGGGLVAVHSSALGFAGDARWARLLGGRWVPGASGHPQIGRALVQSTGSAAGLRIEDFLLYDERYTDLEAAPDVELVAVHTEDGIAHPLVWVRDGPGGRVAYSALGHGVESYESPNAGLLRSLVEWAARMS
jgi:type 1 glutamine amidotransferase